MSISSSAPSLRDAINTSPTLPALLDATLSELNRPISSSRDLLQTKTAHEITLHDALGISTVLPELGAAPIGSDAPSYWTPHGTKQRLHRSDGQTYIVAGPSRAQFTNAPHSLGYDANIQPSLVKTDCTIEREKLIDSPQPGTYLSLTLLIALVLALAEN